MKLTLVQLDKIDRFLVQHQLDFLDFKIEVKDHLATATEAIMEEKAISFENAFALASDSWKTELQVKKSWIISNERSFPEFVIQRIKRNVCLHFAVVLFLVLSLIAFSWLEFISYSLLNYAVITCGIVYFLLRRILMNDKTKTSYRFHFDYFYIPVTLFVIVLIFSDLFVKIPSIYLNAFGLIVIVDLPFAIYYFVKHREFIKKISLT